MRSGDRPRRREREGHQPADGRLCGDLAPAAAQRRPQLQTVYHSRISAADRPRQTADRGQDRGTINSAFVLYLDVFAGVKWSESPRRVPCALLDLDRVGRAPLDPWAPTTRTHTSPDPLVDHHSQYCFNGKSASGKYLVWHSRFCLHMLTFVFCFQRWSSWRSVSSGLGKHVPAVAATRSQWVVLYCRFQCLCVKVLIGQYVYMRALCYWSHMSVQALVSTLHCILKSWICFLNLIYI